MQISMLAFEQALTDDMINEYINEQEGEPVEDDGRFQIDPS